MHEVRKGAGGEAGTIQASGDLTYAGVLLCVLGARDAALTSKRKQGPRNHLGSMERIHRRLPAGHLFNMTPEGHS